MIVAHPGEAMNVASHAYLFLELMLRNKIDHQKTYMGLPIVN